MFMLLMSVVSIAMSPFYPGYHVSFPSFFPFLRSVLKGFINLVTLLNESACSFVSSFYHWFSIFSLYFFFSFFFCLSDFFLFSRNEWYDSLFWDFLTYSRLKIPSMHNLITFHIFRLAIFHYYSALNILKFSL